MRLMVIGTGGFAVPTFESLIDSAHTVTALVTRPPRPVHARGPSPANPMRQRAEVRGVRVIDPEDINTEESRRQLAELEPDLMVVSDYGRILSRETLAVAPMGGINLHASLLPKYRGAAPISWALYHGEVETGVSVIHMTPQLDAGPCLLQRRVPIDPEETAVELEARLADLGVEIVHQAIDVLATWDGQRPLGTVQDPGQVTRAPRLKKTDGLVPWTRSAIQIANQVRAMKPWPGTFTYWRPRSRPAVRLILDRVAVYPDPSASGSPGCVLAAEGELLLVATGSGALELKRIQPAGKRVLDAAEFLRGYQLSQADMLGP
jgi:methionyl-tRNA formyltransferase